MHHSGLAFAQSEAAESSGSKTEDVSNLEEIVVTGSHIRGGEVAGSKVILISREQIDASGYGRVEDVLATVTQNFNRANAAVTEALARLKFCVTVASTSSTRPYPSSPTSIMGPRCNC